MNDHTLAHCMFLVYKDNKKKTKKGKEQHIILKPTIQKSTHKKKFKPKSTVYVRLVEYCK